MSPLSPLAVTLLALSLLPAPAAAQTGSNQSGSKQPPASPPPAAVAAAPARAAAPAAALHAALDRILAARVRDGLVDYAGLRAQDGKALQDYLAAMAAVDVGKLGNDDRFAFYANVYNATMLQAVLDKTAKDAKWTPAAADFAVFKEPLVRLAAGTVSLDHVEHEILRKQFKDARVHVALVCGARSCPPLLPRAYEGQDLGRVLDANLKAFLRDASRNKIGDGRTLSLSKLFEWFRDDFGGDAGVRKLIADEFSDAVAANKIGYLEYSWELNAQPASSKRK